MTFTVGGEINTWLFGAKTSVTSVITVCSYVWLGQRGQTVWKHDEQSECVWRRNEPWVLMNGAELDPASMLRLKAVGYFLPVTTVKGIVWCWDKNVIESVFKCCCVGLRVLLE